MSDKISAIAEKIYSEGLEKANQEKSQIISRAQEEAEEIIAKAKSEAKSLLDNQQKQLEKDRQIANSEIKLAGEQALNALQQKIKTLVSDNLLQQGLKNAFDDATFTQTLLITLLQKWDVKEGISIQTHPEVVESIESALKKSLPHVLTKLEISTDDSVRGFVIQNKNSHFEIAFTEAQFKALLSPFLKQATKRLIFDDNA